VNGYTTPANQPATITANNTTTITGTYTVVPPPNAPTLTTLGDGGLSAPIDWTQPTQSVIGQAFTLGGTRDSGTTVAISGAVSGVTITYPTSTTWQIAGTLTSARGYTTTLSITATASGSASVAATLIIAWG
jgi:hypothetical protein